MSGKASFFKFGAKCESLKRRRSLACIWNLSGSIKFDESGLKIGCTGKLKRANISANNEMQLCLEQTQEKPWCSPTGPVAQWITRLTTDQKIPGSNPGRFDSF